MIRQISRPTSAECGIGDEISNRFPGRGRLERRTSVRSLPRWRIPRQKDLRPFKLLFGIGGLSYGNVSARYNDDWFWMSASGVDKSKLRDIGQHILMVKDYDPQRNGMVVAHPPGVVPKRVSVDAIEHWMIYREHPDVGAILHVHGWINGVPSTEFNYPCGTRELGQAVADMIRRGGGSEPLVRGTQNRASRSPGTSLDESSNGRKIHIAPCRWTRVLIPGPGAASSGPG